MFVSSFSAALNQSFRIFPQLCILFFYMALLTKCISHISFAAFFCDVYFTEVWYMNKIVFSLIHCTSVLRVPLMKDY